MEVVFWCRDRWGRETALSVDTWEDKILLDHFEVLGQEDCVRNALISPNQVNFDVAEPLSRECFYLKGVLPPPDDEDYLKVCVAFTPSSSGAPLGRVVTAYSTPFIKRRGKG